jgi:transposase
MAKPCRGGSKKPTGWNSEFGNANVCSANWGFGCASRAAFWPEPIPHGRRRIKKLRKILTDATIDVWALDEVHFQRQGSRCRMRVPPKYKDPIVQHRPTRNSVGYFGAVRLREGTPLFRRETGNFNGESFWNFLKVLPQTSAVADRRVTAISDNAQYHRSRLHLDWRRQQAPQLALDFLPPNSPELNPIERVWKLTRRLCPPQPLLWFPRDRHRRCLNSIRRSTKPNDTLLPLYAVT